MRCLAASFLRCFLLWKARTEPGGAWVDAVRAGLGFALGEPDLPGRCCAGQCSTNMRVGFWVPQ